MRARVGTGNKFWRGLVIAPLALASLVLVPTRASAQTTGAVASEGSNDTVRCSAAVQHYGLGYQNGDSLDIKCYSTDLLPSNASVTTHAGEAFQKWDSSTGGYVMSSLEASYYKPSDDTYRLFVLTNASLNANNTTVTNAGNNISCSRFDGDGTAGFAAHSYHFACVMTATNTTSERFMSTDPTKYLGFGISWSWRNSAGASASPPSGWPSSFKLQGSPYASGVAKATAEAQTTKHFGRWKLGDGATVSADWPGAWYPNGGESRDPYTTCGSQLLDFDGPGETADLVAGSHYHYSVDLAAPEDGRTITSLTFYLNDDADDSDAVTVANPTVPGRTTFDVVPTSGGPMGESNTYTASNGSVHQKVPTIECNDNAGSGGAWAYGGVYNGINQDPTDGRSLSACITTAGIGWNPDSWVPSLVKSVTCVLRVLFVPTEFGTGGIHETELTDLKDALGGSILGAVAQPVGLLFSMVDDVGDVTDGDCHGPLVTLPMGEAAPLAVRPFEACTGGAADLASVVQLALRLGVYVGATLYAVRLLLGALDGSVDVYQTKVIDGVEGEL